MTSIAIIMAKKSIWHICRQIDPDVYDAIRKADTIGMFQIESRAQMSSLPRNDPKRFYDIW